LTHVRDVGLKQAVDRGIWEWASQNSYTVVTADADFVAMAARSGPPPEVVHLERCDFPLQVIEELLRQNAIRNSEFERNPDLGSLVLRVPIVSTQSGQFGELLRRVPYGIARQAKLRPAVLCFCFR
jgi:predicted nuclease of predicted toxin-antitoxin system